ncbi:hypothetical protein D3C76_1540230 [compost metagenome]
MFGQFDGFGRFIGQAKTGLAIHQDAHENFRETNEHQREPHRHDQPDVPLHDAEMAEVLGTDLGNHQGVDPFETRHRQQPGVGEAAQASDDANQTLDRFARQLHQRIDADVPGGAYAVRQPEKDQPAKQGLGQ